MRRANSVEPDQTEGAVWSGSVCLDTYEHKSNECHACMVLKWWLKIVQWNKFLIGASLTQLSDSITLTKWFKVPVTCCNTSFLSAEVVTVNYGIGFPKHWRFQQPPVFISLQQDQSQITCSHLQLAYLFKLTEITSPNLFANEYIADALGQPKANSWT